MEEPRTDRPDDERALFALSPFEEWQELAWAGALLITLAVLIINILARSVFRQASIR